MNGLKALGFALVLFASHAPAIERTVILISLDGTTPGMLSALPTLRELAEARAVDITPTVLRLLDVPIPPGLDGRPIAGFAPTSGVAVEERVMMGD